MSSEMSLATSNSTIAVNPVASITAQLLQTNNKTTAEANDFAVSCNSFPTEFAAALIEISKQRQPPVVMRSCVDALVLLSKKLETTNKLEEVNDEELFSTVSQSFLSVTGNIDESNYKEFNSSELQSAIYLLLRRCSSSSSSLTECKQKLLQATVHITRFKVNAEVYIIQSFVDLMNQFAKGEEGPQVQKYALWILDNLSRTDEAGKKRWEPVITAVVSISMNCKTDSVRQRVASIIANLASKLKREAVLTAHEALLQMARETEEDGTREEVARAIASIVKAKERNAGEFATDEDRDALIQLLFRAGTNGVREQVCATIASVACCHPVFNVERLRDVLLQTASSATSDFMRENVLKAIANINNSEETSTQSKEVFGTVAVRDTIVAVASATNANAVWLQASKAITNLCLGEQNFKIRDIFATDSIRQVLLNIIRNAMDNATIGAAAVAIAQICHCAHGRHVFGVLEVRDVLLSAMPAAQPLIKGDIVNAIAHICIDDDARELFANIEMHDILTATMTLATAPCGHHFASAIENISRSIKGQEIFSTAATRATLVLIAQTTTEESGRKSVAGAIATLCFGHAQAELLFGTEEVRAALMKIELATADMNVRDSLAAAISNICRTHAQCQAVFAHPSVKDALIRIGRGARSDKARADVGTAIYRICRNKTVQPIFNDPELRNVLVDNYCSAIGEDALCSIANAINHICKDYKPSQFTFGTVQFRDAFVATVEKIVGIQERIAVLEAVASITNLSPESQVIFATCEVRDLLIRMIKKVKTDPERESIAKVFGAICNNNGNAKMVFHVPPVEEALKELVESGSIWAVKQNMLQHVALVQKPVKEGKQCLMM